MNFTPHAITGSSVWVIEGVWSIFILVYTKYSFGCFVVHITYVVWVNKIQNCCKSGHDAVINHFGSLFELL